MKLGPKQRERIEGWLKDLFQQYEIKELDVRDDGVNFKIEVNFNNQPEFYENSYIRRNEIYNSFLTHLKCLPHERDDETFKFTTVDEIAKEWKKSEYIKEASNVYCFDFEQFEKLVTSLLARKPYEDVQNFCNNIQGKILLNYDEFYESLLDDLNKHYQSKDYLYKMHVHEKNSQPTEQFLSLCYDIDEHYSKSYVLGDYLDLDQLININEFEIRPQINNYLNEIRLKGFINEINDKLKDLNNLQYPDKSLFVTNINLDCYSPLAFNIDIEFSDKLSKHQIEQLINSLSFKDIYFEVSYESGYYTINLHYEYSHSCYY